jgi:hypothetical protein
MRRFVTALSSRAGPGQHQWVVASPEITALLHHTQTRTKAPKKGTTTMKTAFTRLAASAVAVALSGIGLAATFGAASAYAATPSCSLYPINYCNLSDPIVAFQANTGDLSTVGAGPQDWPLAMAAGTSPSITKLAYGGFEIAFQANTGDLWTVGTAGTQDWGPGIVAGTSPSITGLTNDGYEVAFQAYIPLTSGGPLADYVCPACVSRDYLETVGTAGTQIGGLMAPGTSPSITGLDNGGYEVAFQSSTGLLSTTGTKGTENWNFPMMSQTSPSITWLTNGGYEMAFQSNTGVLWTTGTVGGRNWNLPMMPHTSPSITGVANERYEVAFQSNTGLLWTTGTAGTASAQNWNLPMMSNTSPSIGSIWNGCDYQGYEVAVQANTGYLGTATTGAGNANSGLETEAGTSPSVREDDLSVCIP